MAGLIRVSLNVGATEPYVSLAGAVSAANSGDTIEVDAGTYKAQDILLSQDLTIEAAGNSPVVLEQSRPLAKRYADCGFVQHRSQYHHRRLNVYRRHIAQHNGTGIATRAGI